MTTDHAAQNVISRVEQNDRCEKEEEFGFHSLNTFSILPESRTTMTSWPPLIAAVPAGIHLYEVGFSTISPTKIGFIGSALSGTVTGRLPWATPGLMNDMSPPEVAETSIV